MTGLHEEKMEYCSGEWLALLRKLLLARELVNPDPARGSICEVYRNVPAHLCTNASRTLAWTLLRRDGEASMEFQEAPADAVDRKTVGDYAALAQLNRFLITAENEAQFLALVDRTVRQGLIAITTAPGTPAARPDYTVHNYMAALTR